MAHCFLRLGLTHLVLMWSLAGIALRSLAPGHLAAQLCSVDNPSSVVGGGALTRPVPWVIGPVSDVHFRPRGTTCSPGSTMPLGPSSVDTLDPLRTALVLCPPVSRLLNLLLPRPESRRLLESNDQITQHAHVYTHTRAHSHVQAHTCPQMNTHTDTRGLSRRYPAM